MIRANLLPRPKERVGMLGIDIDSHYVRQALLGLGIVLAVAAIGFGIERVRLHRLETLALASEAEIVQRLPQRIDSKRLALDVARYQEFEREAQAFRRSGDDAAVTIARIGNRVPSRVRLDSIAADARGFELRGNSGTVEALSGTMSSLAGALPRTDASLVDTDDRGTHGTGVHFTARIDTPLAGDGRP